MQCTGALQDFIIASTTETFSSGFLHVFIIEQDEMGVSMENSDVDELDTNELSYCIYPIDDAPPESPEIFYREWIKKHSEKIPIHHTSNQDFVCDLFLRDVKIRKKMKEFISETSLRERISNLFF